MSMPPFIRSDASSCLFWLFHSASLYCWIDVRVIHGTLQSVWQYRYQPGLDPWFVHVKDWRQSVSQCDNHPSWPSICDVIRNFWKVGCVHVAWWSQDCWLGLYQMLAWCKVLSLQSWELVDKHHLQIHWQLLLLRICTNMCSYRVCMHTWVTCRNNTIGPNKPCSHYAMNVWFLGCLEWSLKPWNIHNTFFMEYIHTQSIALNQSMSTPDGRASLIALPEHKRCSSLDVVSPAELLLNILQQTWGWFGGENWTTLKPSWFMELQNDFCICLVGC